MVNQERFQDDGLHLEDFMAEILVKCPRCSKCAIYRTSSPCTRAFFFSKRFAHAVPGKLVCPMCGFSKIIVDDMLDKMEAYLQTHCCNEILWALNEKHLEFLDGYVNARLRDKVPSKHPSLATNLPSWIKSKKNREQVVKGLERLRVMLNESE